MEENPAMKATQRVCSASEAGKYLGLSLDTLRKYTDLGLIQAYNMHGRRAYKIEDLDRYIDSLPKWGDTGTRIKPAEAQTGGLNGLHGKR